MFSFYNIRIIANFEIKTLLRGWFFRIFAGLAILGIGIFNIAAFVEASGAPWIFRALPAAIPYANLIILNLGQAVVAVFLASEFLKQDKKNDTIEVIYARSMTNAEYILGKTLGILIVFFILNIILLSLGIGFSFLSSDSSRNILAYFYYPFLISLPTLVYVLGLSFFLMVLVKNQAVTFILLLGYIALTIFYLNYEYFHLSDFVAFNVPLLHSTIGGFGNINEVLIHRGIYFFIGLGLISFTIHKLNRLPQAGKFQLLPLILTCIFLITGAYFANKYIKLKKGNIEYKKELIALNNALIDYPFVHVDTCNIDLEHEGDEISVKTDMIISNKTTHSFDTLIFSLNPDLKVTSVFLEEKEAKILRNKQILKIISDRKIKPHEMLRVSINYRGKINENISFIDPDLDEYDDNLSLDIYRIRKRSAYLQKNFVCLTRESYWYPVSGVGHSSLKPAVYLPDFTTFSLKVKTEEDLTAVSQGDVKKISEGEFQFKPEFPLPKISLLIADYIKYDITVDSINYCIYTRRGNDFYKNYFKEAEDSIPNLIRELKDEYESFIEFTYPFKRFILAETPIQFSLDRHIWSVSSNAVQPEIIFYPEKGVLMEETDFKKRKKREEERMKEDNEEILPEELQARIFKRFVRGNFMATPKERYMFREIVDRNSYTIFPNFYSFVTQIKSDKWPQINIALESYLRDRNFSNEESRNWFTIGINLKEQINLELKNAPMDKLIKSGIEKSESDDDIVTINDVILEKGKYLFTLLKIKYEKKDFNAFLESFIRNHIHKSADFDTLIHQFSKRFNDTITNDIEQWYGNSMLPAFLIKDIENYKVIENEYSRYQIRFKISNPKEVDGLITVSVEMADEENRNNQEWDDLANTGFTKTFYIPAKSAKEIGFVFSDEPARMKIFTHISENLPNKLEYDFKSFDQTKRISAFDSVKDYTFFKDINLKDEIIVDNEDEGFEYDQFKDQSYLKSIINKNKKQKYKYSSIPWWNLPNSWQTNLRSGFYGKYIKSAMYTKTGDGSRTAEWHAEITAPGYYDIYTNIERIDFRWRSKEKYNYNYKIYHSDGIEEISLEDQEIESGWNYLGTFYISSPEAKVVLTNKSYGNIIFADAIKWVKSK